MPQFDYKIQTTNGLAEGTIEADDESDAEKKLTDIYLPKDHGFIDSDDKPVEHKLIKLELNQVG